MRLIRGTHQPHASRPPSARLIDGVPIVGIDGLDRTVADAVAGSDESATALLEPLPIHAHTVAPDMQAISVEMQRCARLTERLRRSRLRLEGLLTPLREQRVRGDEVVRELRRAIQRKAIHDGFPE